MVLEGAAAPPAPLLATPLGDYTVIALGRLEPVRSTLQSEHAGESVTIRHLKDILVIPYFVPNLAFFTSLKNVVTYLVGFMGSIILSGT